MPNFALQQHEGMTLFTEVAELLRQERDLLSISNEVRELINLSETSETSQGSAEDVTSGKG